MTNFVQRHRLLTFYVISLVWAMSMIVLRSTLMPGGQDAVLHQLWAFVDEKVVYQNLATIIWFAIARNPLAWLFTVYAIAPTIAALITSAIAGGRAEVRVLLSRLRPWREGVSARDGVRLYAALLLFYFIGAAAYLFLASRLGRPGEFADIIARLGTSVSAIVGTLLVGLLVDEGGTLEELGWRGFALPLLNARMATPLLASVSLGVVWWAWHLPREVPTWLAGSVSLAYFIGQGTFLLLCVALSIVIGYACNRSGGSVWPAILVHAGTNVWSKALSGPLNRFAGTDVRTLVLCAVALGIIALEGRRLGLRQWNANVPNDRTAVR